MAIGYELTVTHKRLDGTNADEFILNGPHDGREIASTRTLVVKFEHTGTTSDKIQTHLTLKDKPDAVSTRG
jgi:hypothetical protein